MSRVTEKMVKQWLDESDFAITHGMRMSAWSGYYHILNSEGSIICAGKTPNECWREFTLYKAGYYLGLREAK